MTASPRTTSESVAVFDLGKTNSKLFVFSADGKILGESRTKPVWINENGLRVLDDNHLFSWMQESLADAVTRYGVRRVTFSGHGCTFALIEGDRLAHAILDYEQELPDDLARGIDALIPPFDETFSPKLPLGLNYGRHILWLEERDPALLKRADAILAYPQFWVWRFSGCKVSEVSYLGCHSHLWAPLKDDFSRLVNERNWRDKLPAFARAGAEVGSTVVSLTGGGEAEVAVHNGVHDSNASLYYYRSLGFADFTLVSTGTWVIILNTGCSLDFLDRKRDMLSNVTVDHQPTATIRFMGGREYDIASGGWASPVSMDAVAAVIAKQAFALPSFAAGGPFPDAEGSFAGPSVVGEEKAAAALLYIALMTDLSLDLIRSSNPIVIDGGLVKTGLYAGVLAALRPDQDVFTSANAEGSAFGAAALTFELMGIRPFVNDCQKAAPLIVQGLNGYRTAWRRMAADKQVNPATASQQKEMQA
jgi:sugar (pentulose or hexulose) kinase